MQPADVGWFKVLKSYYKKFWCDWFLNDKKKLTKHGNLAGPGYENMTKWLLKSWLYFDTASIIHSFQYCGITCETPHDYHSELKELLSCQELPPYQTIEIRSEHDDQSLSHLFINIDYDDEDDENDEDYEANDEENQMSEIDDNESISSENYSSDSDENLVDIESEENVDSEESSDSDEEISKIPASNKRKLNHESPTYTSKSSRLQSKSPNLQSKSPNLQSKSPNLPSKSPKLQSKSPNLPSKSPNLPSKSPKFKSSNMQTASHSSKLTNKSENAFTNTPNLSSKFSKLSAKPGNSLLTMNSCTLNLHANH